MVSNAADRPGVGRRSKMNGRGRRGGR